MDDSVAEPEGQACRFAAPSGPAAADPSDPPGAAPAVDHSVLTALLSILGVGAATAEADIIDTYLDELPRLVGQMRDSITSGDRETLHRAVHALKSSSANMGAMRLSELSAELEDRTRDAIPADVPAAAADVAAEGGRVERALRMRRRELDQVITGRY